MVRSIQVFQYEYPLGLGEIAQMLSKGRKIRYKKKDKLNKLKQVNLTATILKIEKIKNSLRGSFTYEYQDVVNRNTPQENSSIQIETFEFLISSSQNCLIIGGAHQYRSHVSRLLSFLIHQESNELDMREDEKSSFKKITIAKLKMSRLIMKIKSYDVANDVSKPEFEFIDNKLKDLDDITYSQTGICIMNHPFFKAHYPVATYWSPKMRIRRCNGIVDEIDEDKVAVTLGKHAEFSMRRDLSQENWARFVLETCKSAKVF